MKGSVFAALRTLVTDRYGAAQWAAALETAGVEAALYLPLEGYPDDTLARIAAAVSMAQGEPLDDLLFAHGRHLAGTLRKSHPALFRPGRTAREIVRLIGAPPEASAVGFLDLMPIRYETTDPEESQVRFTGLPPLCMLAKGLVTGLARETNERVAVHETQCQKRGAVACMLRLVFTHAAEPSTKEKKAAPAQTAPDEDTTVVGSPLDPRLRPRSG